MRGARRGIVHAAVQHPPTNCLVSVLCAPTSAARLGLNDGETKVMQAVLSFLSGAVMIGLVYGLSFIPTATLSRPDDEVGVGMVGDDTTAPDADPADVPRNLRRRPDI